LTGKSVAVLMWFIAAPPTLDGHRTVGDRINPDTGFGSVGRLGKSTGTHCAAIAVVPQFAKR
jgi:hypothetical protein